MLNPLVAGPLQEAGWNKEDLRYFVYEKARWPLAEALEGPQRGGPGVINPESKERRPLWLDIPDENVMVPVLRKPENLLIVVAGPRQRHRLGCR